MSHSPSGMLDSLEIETQYLAQDNEPQQSGLRASNGTSSMVVDGNHKDTRDSQSPLFVSDESPVPPTLIIDGTLPPVARDGIQVIVPSIQRRWEYLPYEEPIGGDVTEESDYSERLQAASILSGGVNKEKLPTSRHTRKSDGADAMKTFYDRSSRSKSSEPITRRSTRQALSRDSRTTGFADFSNLQLSSDDELSMAKTMKDSFPRKRRLLSTPGVRSNRQSSDADPSVSDLSASESRSENTGSEDDSTSRRQDREISSRPTRRGRSSGKRRLNYAERLVVDDSDSDETDGSQALGKRKRGQPKRSSGRKIRKSINSPRRPEREPVEGTRRSGRTGRALRNMREIFEDDIPDVSSAKADTKFSGAKENYRQLLQDSDFCLRHCQTCDTCNEDGEIDEKGQLIYCQGCTMSYHQKCLGPRSNRDHLVTKIGANESVLQCRRCIGVARKKDAMAPNQDECSECHIKGKSSNGFREKKSSKQEQKDREDNDGEDPIEPVPDRLINNFENVLFRCVKCYRAWHMDCLPARTNSPFAQFNEENIATERFGEYSLDWSCQDCVDAPAEIDCLVAWRPIDQANYEPGTSTELIPEDNKEYLVKYKKMSYFKTAWKSGAWVWGITASAMRKAFARRDNGNNLPKMRTEDAIPEEYLRVDIVLDVEYTNIVKVHVEKVDLARIQEVKKALVKFKGLGYEDVVWEEPPDAVDSHRWDDFKSAYEYWVLGRYVHLPSPQSLSSHLKNVRSQSFKDKIEIDKQPEYLTGGELYPYQMEGMNWLYYQWHRQQNAILADEMGLGKTIQIIGFLATLQQTHKCWPFLVVVPNSTCPNWRREIKRWSPALRVVAYYGSSESRKLAEKYELFPGGGKDLRCHIVITSYEAAQQDEFRKVFRGVSWQGLIVDEGQRLKNDKNILYEALNNLRAPFKVLLTGTPLQNNPRELFNLLQFLDKTNDAQALEKEYAILTEEKVSTLHTKLKKLMLRRTKAGALKRELPPMAQIIVPVTMSVVQKKLYKSIIAKNSELIKSIFGASQRSLKQTDRANLNNILMQLRKCLCHPFVYSKAIEERSSNAAISHRNLVEASSKLKLLEIMLPKLQALGHRVLIFSQFLAMLDIVEDFLDGLGLLHRRLDGSMNALQKQKRIDEFNAPTSSVFAFLLSTRAGGVGINLATADTVIILDPDFNPHQDIQALSRAHRIGQTKPVLVLQLTTRDSAEEKIMQVGKKKMALDHALIEQMGAAQDDAGMDLASILRHGAEAVFKDDDTHDIHYDSASVDKLLDRSQIETAQASKGDSVESQFSFARVWANDKSSLEDMLTDTSETDANIASSTWEKILKTREQEVAAETVAKSEDFGRGRRKRQTVDYKHVSHGPADSPGKEMVLPYVDRSDSDAEFQARAIESDGEDSAEDNGEDVAEDLDVEVTIRRPEPTHQPSWVPYKPLQSPVNTEGPFKRAEVPLPASYAVLPSGKSGNELNQTARNGTCLVCSVAHPLGHCPLKQAGAERCGLCGIAHYTSGLTRICPHLNSVTQCRAMLETLKSSTEPQADIEHAKKYLVGVIGGLNRKKKPKDQALQQPVKGQASNGQASNHNASDADVDMNSILRGNSRPGKENMAVEPRTLPTASYPHARGRK